jgi:hypothetical protein
MENIIPNPTQFFDHIFNEKTKSEMLNIIQYSLTAIVPIVVLNKTMAYYIPEADERKDSIEIILEILLQVIFMFVGVFIVHRAVSYIPPSSGVSYPELNVIPMILSVLLIILSLQTKIGEKVSILSQRVVMFWSQREGLQMLAPENISPRSIQPLATSQQTTTPLSQLPQQQPQQMQPQQMQPQQMQQMQPQQMQQPQQQQMQQPQQQQQPMTYSSNIHPQQSQQNFEPIAPYSSGDKFGQW